MSGAMLARARAVAAAALQKGSLRPIDTHVELVAGADAEVGFAVRVVKALTRKDGARAGRDVTKSAGDAAGGEKRAWFNPFLPYEADMFVADVAPAHVVLLNKFPVVGAHLLLVTAAYEPQNALLTARDFAALWRMLAGVAGALAFYNAGRVAGASQTHKHLQVVAGPLAPGLAPGQAPFHAALAAGARAAPPGEPFRVPAFPFAHAAVGMADCAAAAPDAAADLSMARYTEMLRLVVRAAEELREQPLQGNAAEQPLPYNLLVTREWMLIVPRREECFDGVSVNSLGFAGCLLVRDEAQLEMVKKVGPMAVLEHTGFSKASH